MGILEQDFNILANVLTLETGASSAFYQTRAFLSFLFVYLFVLLGAWLYEIKMIFSSRLAGVTMLSSSLLDMTGT